VCVFVLVCVRVRARARVFVLEVEMARFAGGGGCEQLRVGNMRSNVLRARQNDFSRFSRDPFQRLEHFSVP
jgi:hypothetical protein